MNKIQAISAILCFTVIIMLTATSQNTFASEADANDTSTVVEIDDADVETPLASVSFNDELSVISDSLTASISSSIAAAAENSLVSGTSFTKSDLMYLSVLVFCEAGNQSYKGKVAVADCVLNRLNSDEFSYDSSIKEVVYDCRYGRQFSPVYAYSAGRYSTSGSVYAKVLSWYKSGNYNNSIDEACMKECVSAVKAAFAGKNVIGDKIYFNAYVSSTKSKCVRNGIDYQIIGGHIFY